MNEMAYIGLQRRLSLAGDLLRQFTSLASLESSDPITLSEELDTLLPSELDKISEVLDGHKKFSSSRVVALKRLRPLIEKVAKVVLPPSRHYSAPKANTQVVLTKTPEAGGRLIRLLKTPSPYRRGSNKDRLYQILTSAKTDQIFMEMSQKVGFDKRKAKIALRKMVKSGIITLKEKKS